MRACVCMWSRCNALWTIIKCKFLETIWRLLCKLWAFSDSIFGVSIAKRMSWRLWPHSTVNGGTWDKVVNRIVYVFPSLLGITSFACVGGCKGKLWSVFFDRHCPLQLRTTIWVHFIRFLKILFWYSRRLCVTKVSLTVNKVSIITTRGSEKFKIEIGNNVFLYIPGYSSSNPIRTNSSVRFIHFAISSSSNAALTLSANEMGILVSVSYYAANSVLNLNQ